MKNDAPLTDRERAGLELWRIAEEIHDLADAFDSYEGEEPHRHRETDLARYIHDVASTVGMRGTVLKNTDTPL